MKMVIGLVLSVTTINVVISVEDSAAMVGDILAGEKGEGAS
jgi:hypothetical protein